jgi:hypothetical protein
VSLDGSLPAKVAAFAAEVGRLRALVVGGDFERAARACGGFLEDQGDVLVLQMADLGSGRFGLFQGAGQVQQADELVGGGGRSPSIDGAISTGVCS